MKSRRHAYLVALAAAYLMFALAALPSLQVETASAAGSAIQYDTTMTRYYKSSVDGATLPCSLYVPSTNTKMPVWVDLHAFGGPGGFSDNMIQTASTNGCIMVSPWGRNYHSFYTDGTETETSTEPSIFDDFSDGTLKNWSNVVGNRWAAQGEACQQLDQGDYWKLALRSGSSGSYCTASADITTIEASGGDGSSECSAGLFVRRQANGAGYLIDMDRNSVGISSIRIWRFSGTGWTMLGTKQLPVSFNVNLSHNLKVVMFEDNLEVHLDYILITAAQDTAYTSGEVAVASFGGSHTFDNVRVQNETLYGERDIMDSIDQCLEELSPVEGEAAGIADSSRVFISGASMGGLGAWNLGLHYPDRFSYIHPAYGPTDVLQGYEWIKAQYPDYDPTVPVNGQYLAREQDAKIAEAIRAMIGGSEPGSSTLLSSSFHENSARYLLENALNTPVRIEHAEYDTLVPNTTSPLTIKRLTTEGIWIILDGTQKPSSSYAHSQGIWQTLVNTPGLTGCTPETSMYDAATGNPGPLVDTLGIWNNTDYSAMDNYNYGAHCAVTSDTSLASPVYQSFLRLDAKYGERHEDPDDVAYRTYDATHDKAWWLTVEAAYPDQDKPGLARVHRDKSANSINAHVKNVSSITLDVKRMGLVTKSGGLSITLDSNTAPESEFKITDEYHKTDLRLVGDWNPSMKSDYQVSLDGSPVAFDMTGTTVAIKGVDTTTARTISVTAPPGLDDLDLVAGSNPGFESGTTGWTASMAGGLNGTLELDREKRNAHTGTNSIRIKNPKATAAPYTSSWQSDPFSVSAGCTYTLDAFAKTRALNSSVRSYENGKYSDSSCSNAGVAIMWLKADGSIAGWNKSEGIHDTTDWAPLEVSAVAPAEAIRARAVLFTVGVNNQGINGSVWYDDISLKGEPMLGVSSISPASAAGTSKIGATITGTGFKHGAAVRLVQGQATIIATDIVVASSTSITCKLDLSGQAAGSWDVIVRNPDGQEVKLTSGFTITTGCGQGASAGSSAFAASMGLLTLAGTMLRKRSKST